MPHVSGQPETEGVGRAGSMGARQTPFDLPSIALNILSRSTSGGTGLILHGGNEGNCLRCPWSLPWCP